MGANATTPDRGAPRPVVHVPTAFFPALFLRQANAPSFVAAALVPLLVATWLLLSPGRVFSSEMTWDLLFNLAGAWHLYNGQVAHVDFHDPLGSLSFILTAIGFRVVGTTPLAILVGVVMVCAAIFVSATFVAVKRLPLLPALVFVLYVSLLVLMPVNVGDSPTVYSFAMAYNRYGWSALCILFLILFLPPRVQKKIAIADLVIASLLLVALYYLKITYFLAGLGALAVALVISDHIQANLRLWLAVCCIVAANAVAPYNFAYLQDIADAMVAGDARLGLRDHLLRFLENGAENALALGQFLIVIWLWMRRRATVKLVLACAVSIAAGLFVLSQNAQNAHIPLYIAMSCLLYDALHRELVGAPANEARRSVPLLVAVLAFPILLVCTSFSSLVGYYVKASSVAGTSLVDWTNLRHLAVPNEPTRLLRAFARGDISFETFNRMRVVKPRYELSQSEYIETILEAAETFGDDADSRPKVLVLDQVNPLPFALGFAPPKGGNLWYGPGLKWRDPVDVFADVDVVLVPKFPTFDASTSEALQHYGDVLARDFPVSYATPSWIVMRRSAQAANPSATDAMNSDPRGDP